MYFNLFCDINYTQINLMNIFKYDPNVLSRVVMIHNIINRKVFD